MSRTAHRTNFLSIGARNWKPGGDTPWVHSHFLVQRRAQGVVDQEQVTHDSRNLGNLSIGHVFEPECGHFGGDVVVVTELVD
jgi:hypothetical protein